MRSVEHRFKYIQRMKPEWSTWTCFAKTVQGRNFSKETIREHFNALVDKNEYVRKEKSGLLKYLYTLTKDKL
jgi:hypothetical protein